MIYTYSKHAALGYRHCSSSNRSSMDSLATTTGTWLWYTGCRAWGPGSPCYYCPLPAVTGWWPCCAACTASSCRLTTPSSLSCWWSTWGWTSWPTPTDSSWWSKAWQTSGAHLLQVSEWYIVTHKVTLLSSGMRRPHLAPGPSWGSFCFCFVFYFFRWAVTITSPSLYHLP